LSERKQQRQGLKIHHSLWKGPFRYDVHIMSEQPPPTEYGWNRIFLVEKKLFGWWKIETLLSPPSHKPIIYEIKEKFNL